MYAYNSRKHEKNSPNNLIRNVTTILRKILRKKLLKTMEKWLFCITKNGKKLKAS